MRLSAQDVSHQYPRVQQQVLYEVSLEVAIGDRIAVVGPSGSGKTTLLAILGGMLAPTAGRVAVVADGTRHLAAHYVSWVLQTTNVLPDRSTLDNVAIGGFSAGLSRREVERRSRSALASVGMVEQVCQPVRHLSGGEMQRVAAARSIISGRPFVLADEPTGQLDQATSIAVLDALFDNSVPRGIVVVTHDPMVADRCDRVYQLVNAQLVSS